MPSRRPGCFTPGHVLGTSTFAIAVAAGRFFRYHCGRSRAPYDKGAEGEILTCPLFGRELRCRGGEQRWWYSILRGEAKGVSGPGRPDLHGRDPAGRTTTVPDDLQGSGSQEQGSPSFCHAPCGGQAVYVARHSPRPARVPSLHWPIHPDRQAGWRACAGWRTAAPPSGSTGPLSHTRRSSKPLGGF
jgi:hypothetical protein